MPEDTQGQAPADGTQDSTPAKPEAKAEGTPEKTFTQSDVDRIVTERLSRAVPSDYESLKSRAAQWDEHEAAQKSELDKALERAEKAEALAKEAVTTANERVRRAEILQEAAAQSAADPETVFALLRDSDEITIDKDGAVTGTKDAVAKLLKEKAFLKADGTPAKAGGEFGGQESKTLDQKIAEAQKAGDWAESRRLKLQKVRIGT